MLAKKLLPCCIGVFYCHVLSLTQSEYVRSHIGWGGERNILIRVWKSLPSRRVLKTLRGSSKRTISASGELGLLQMVLETDTGRFVSEEVEP